MTEKAINAKAKTSFQLPLEIKKINSRCLKDYKLVKNNKTNKDN